MNSRMKEWKKSQTKSFLALPAKTKKANIPFMLQEAEKKGVSYVILCYTLDYYI